MSDVVADQITDFDVLTVRHIGRHDYRVLNREKGTVSEVDLDDVTCTCEDMAYNRDGGRAVCKHVQMAMFQAPSDRITVEDTAPFYLSEAVDRAQTAAEQAEIVVDDLDKGLTQVRDEQAHNAAQRPHDDTSPAPQANVGLEDVEDWFTDGYANPSLVDIRNGRHNDTQGVILEPDSQAMTDGDSEQFKALIKTLEDSEVHTGFLDDGCNECNVQDDDYWWFIPSDDSSEVWQ